MSPITNPTEEYFKDGLWGWVTDQWKKLVADAAGHLQVDVLTSGLPAGSATAANQTTMITALQLIDNIYNTLASIQVDELRTAAIPHAIWQVGAVTQVHKRASADNGITIIYAVPVDKTFYLTNLYVSGTNAGGALANGYVYIRTAAPAELVRYDVACQDANQRTVSINFNPPVEMPSGYDILVRSLLANYTLYATVHGYTI